MANRPLSPPSHRYNFIARARDSDPSRPSVPRFVSSTPSMCSETSLVQELHDRIRIKTSTTRTRSLISTLPTSFDFHLVALRPTSRTLLASPFSLTGYILGYCPYSPSLLTCIDRSISRITAKYWRTLIYIEYCGSPLAGHGSFIGLLFVFSTSLRDFLLPAFSLRSSLRQSGQTCRRTLTVERQEPVSFCLVPTLGALPPLLPTAAGLTSSPLARLFRL
ncbi:hypothetical protein BJV78DRAFT_1248908 [Lactifluus subvellereus]|nr:hypothetical protein BJV78DRAFT_1248908 [Lactifluus subvellereus]